MTMPTQPGAQVAGRLEVPVVADLSGFRDDLVDGVKKAVKGPPPVEAVVPVKADGTGLRKELQTIVKAAQRNIQAQVGINWNATRLRQRLEKQVDAAAAGVKAKIGVDLDPDRLRGELQRAVDTAAAGVTAKVKVEVDQDDARKSLTDTFDSQTVRVKVDKDSLRADVAAALDGVVGSGGLTDRPGRPPRTTDPQVSDQGIRAWLRRFREARATAAAEAKANPIDVPVNVDPKSHFGNPPALRRVLRGALLGSMIALIQPAIATIAGAVGPIVTLVGPLAQAVGSLGAAAPVIAAAITGVAAGVIGFSGMGDALGAMSAAADTAGKSAEELAQDQENLERVLGKLPKPMQEVARELFAVGQAFKPVRQAVQTELFSKLAGHILEPARRALPVLQRGLVLASGQIGQLGADIAHLAGSERFLRPLGVFFESSNRILASLRRAVTPLMGAAVDFLAAASPAGERLAKAFERGARQFERMVSQGKNTGAIADFLDEALDQASRLWRMVKNVGGAFKGIFTAGMPIGNQLLDRLDRTLRKFNEWANSPEGQDSIREYLEDLLPVFDEVILLVGDIGKALGRLARDPDTAKLISQIRTELVPALEKFLDTLGESLGPTVVDVISSLVTVLANLGEAGGGIATAVEAIDDLFDIINEFLVAHPTAAENIGKLVGIIAGAAILRTSLGLFLKPFNGLLTAVTGFGSKGAKLGLAGITALFGLKTPSWFSGSGGDVGKDGKPKKGGAIGGIFSKKGQKVYWDQCLPVYLCKGGGGTTAAGGSGGDGDGDDKKTAGRKASGGVRGKVAGAAVAAGVGAAALGGRLIGRKGAPPTPIIPGSIQSKARRAAAAEQGARAVKPTSALGKLGDLAKKVPGKGTIVGILGSLAVAPVAKAVTGDGKSTARNVAGGALSGAVNGAGIGALIGSVVPVVGTGIGAAAGGAAGGIWGGITAGFPEVETKVKGWAAGLGGLAVAGIGKAGSKGKAFGWVAKHADDVIPAVKKGIDKVGPAVSGGLSKVGEVGGKAFNGLRDKSMSALNTLRDKGGQAASATRDRVVTAYQGARDKVGTAATALRDRATTALNSARDRVGTAAAAARDRATTAYNAARDRVGTATTQLRDRAGTALNAARDRVGTAAVAARDRATTAYNAARDRVGTATTQLRDRAGTALNAARDRVGTAASTARDRVGTAFTTMRDRSSGASGTLRDKVSGAFNTMKDNVVRHAGRMRDDTGSRIDGLKSKFSTPIRFVADKVLGGLRKVFNNISGIVKGPQISPISLGFAKGGVVPGYAPGKDTVPAMVSPGEGWLVPEAVRGLAKRMGMAPAAAIRSLNAAFSNRVSAPAGGGHDHQEYAKGGVVPGGVQRFHLGGITHNARHAADTAAAAAEAAARTARRAAGAVGNVASSAVGAVKDVVQGGLRKAFDAALGGIQNLMPGAGPGMMADLGRATARATFAPLGKYLTKKDAEIPPVTAGMGYQAMMRVLHARFPGLQLISGLRPGAITATGNPSYHGKGRAVDIPPRMDVFEHIKKNYGAKSIELIFSPANGRQMYRGQERTYGEPTRGDHFDHIHWSVKLGGLIGRLGDLVRRASSSGAVPGLGRGATVLPRPGGTLARIAESGRAETIVDAGKMNDLMAQVLRSGGINSKPHVLFEEGSVVVNNPVPERAGESVPKRLREVAAFGLFG